MRDSNDRKKYGDLLRERNNPNPNSVGGIGSIWAEQMQTEREEAELQKKYQEAKKQAKELRKSILKNQLGDGIDTVGGVFNKSKNIFVSSLSKLKVKKYQKILAVTFGVLLVVVVGFNILSRSGSKETLGDSVTTELAIKEDLPREKPAFSLMFPNGNDASEYDVVRISPPEADASYTYLDRFTEDGNIFRVTQQEIPDNFDLAKTATDFQATSIIQVDENVIYHGYSEKGGVQSVLFIKDKKLVSIRSPQKFSDDQWAGYFLSLE